MSCYTRLYWTRSALLGLAAIAATAMPLESSAQASSYPNRPVRWVISFPPGGSNDIIARVVAAPLGERLGRTVVIDNRGGANGIVGAEIAAQSPPDGHTLFMISVWYTINPILYNKLPYDTLKSFDWVAMLGSGPNALAVPPSSPAKSVKELIAMAKAKPGQIVYASTGVGSNAHFGTELFKHMAGIDMMHVPFKGGAQALVGIAGGQVQVLLSSLIQSLPLVRGGKLRLLATTQEKRSAVVPDVPTMIEAGVPGYVTQIWWGVTAPRGTPRAIIQRLNEEYGVVLKQPDVQKRLLAEGAETDLKTPEELGRYVADEMARWVKVAKIAGIKGE